MNDKLVRSMKPNRSPLRRQYSICVTPVNFESLFSLQIRRTHQAEIRTSQVKAGKESPYVIFPEVKSQQVFSR